MALQTSPATCRYPGLGLQRREDWNSALPEIRPEQNQNSSSLPRGGDQDLQSSAQAEGLRLSDSCIQDRGTRKKRGRIGRVESKEREKGRQVN